MEKLDLSPARQPDRMRGYWLKEWPTVAMVVFTGTAFNASMSAGPLMQGRIIDRMLAGDPTVEIARQIALYAAVIFFIQLLRLGKRYAVRLFANRTNARMRATVYDRVLRKPMAELERERAGDLMTRAVSDVNVCVEGMRKATTEVFDTGVLMASYLLTLLSRDWLVTLTACAFIPLAMLTAEKLKLVVYRFAQAYREKLGLVAEMTMERAENALLYRTAGMEGSADRAYDESLGALEKAAVRSQTLESSMQPVYNVAATLGVLLIVWLGGERVVSGAWTVGGFTAYLTVFLALAKKASRAAKLFNAMQKARVSWKRVQPYLKEPEPETGTALPEDWEKHRNTLTAEHLSFTYPQSERPTLTDICFDIAQGEWLGVAGPVASGKSTLGLLLQGFYPYQGSLRVRGLEISGLNANAIGQLVACVGHDAQLLSDTLEENIRLGDGGDVRPVLQDVCFDHDLLAMPQGVKTVVGPAGVRLSGGQQARIALARALYKPCSVLLLDDPFAACDVQTERAILHTLRTKYRDRIVVLISHRLSSFPQMDRVLLLENGGALCAPHEQLLERSPVYRELYERQKGATERA